MPRSSVASPGCARTSGRSGQVAVVIHGPLAAHPRDGCLVAEPSESGADAVQCGSERLRGTKSRLAGEFSAERDPDLVQTVAARSFGQGVDNEADQLLVAALRELDRRQLGRDPVGLGRSPGAGARASRPPLERGNQETRLREPFESATGDIAVNLQSRGDIVGGHRQRPHACEEERLAKIAISDCVEPMHHPGNAAVVAPDPC